MTPDPELAGRLQALLGKTAVEFLPVAGGYTPVYRAIAAFSDGSSAFLKLAVDDQTAGWLRSERTVYEAVSAPFMPGFLAFDDGGFPLLVLEDLSAWHWPPPWRPGDVEQVGRALAKLAGTTRPAGLQTIRDRLGSGPAGWEIVADDPRPLLSLGLCGPFWLERALPALIAAEQAAPLEGDDFLHLDVRSDNLCLGERGAVLVDWNLACRGNRLADVAFWLPSLQAEGGPLPEAMLPDQPELAAWVAGFFAARAGLPDIPTAPRVRSVQRQQLVTALHWAARALGLSAPVRETQV